MAKCVPRQSHRPPVPPGTELPFPLSCLVVVASTRAPTAHWLTGKGQKVQDNWGPNGRISSKLPPAFSEHFWSAELRAVIITFSVSHKSSPPLATAVHLSQRKQCTSVTLIHGTDTAHQLPASDMGSDRAAWTAQHRIPQGTY